MAHDTVTSRRSFLQAASFGLATYAFHPFATGSDDERSVLRFGLIADVHQDIMHDACQRISAFVDAMSERKADFICQLGDFCRPDDRNREFLERWNAFDGPRIHVLGNHDMDGGYSREQTVAFFGMPDKRYSLDTKGVHIVVLDGNDPGGQGQGYKRYISTEQLRWLQQDLEATSLPTLVFSHQTLDDAAGVENAKDVRRVLEAARTPSNQKKVVACFCGHHHDDQARQINGIHYIRINSASYAWLGSRYKHESYEPDIHREHPWISHTAPYEHPLWAYVEMDVTKGRLSVTGKETAWVGPTPWDLGIDAKTMNPKTCGPRISDRELSFWKTKVAR